MATGNPEFKRTIIIGLGGAGKLILTHLKRLFLDEYNMLPPSIKILCLDTDPDLIGVRSAKSEEEIRLDDHELLYTNVTQPIKFVESSPVVKKWFVTPVPAGPIDRGAGAVRQYGRLAFFYHINEFRRRIDSMWEGLCDMRLPDEMANVKNRLGAATNFQLSNKSTSVYVCGSLAGGTGSGTFLDVGILLRDMVPNSLIHGFFLLNWIYRNKAFANRVQGNVYAALAELDNIQSIMYGDRGFVPYEVTYADKLVQVTDPPYSLVNLVDGRNEVGQNINDVGVLCDTVANAIFLSTSAMGNPIDSVMDNLLAHISVQNPKVWDGRFARYSSFGVSSICYPAREIHKLVTSENAYRLCCEAISDVEGLMSGSSTSVDNRQDIVVDDVERILGRNQLNLLNRGYVQDKVCPFQMNIALPVRAFHISDRQFPKLIRSLFEKEENRLIQKLDQIFKENENLFVNDTAWLALEQKIREIEQDPQVDTAYLKTWIETTVGRLQAQRNEATADVNQEDENLRNQREQAEDLLNAAREARYIPGFGGPRKKAVTNWTAQIAKLLASVRNKKRAEFEKQSYDHVIEMLNTKRPDRVQASSEVIGALETAKEALSKMEREVDENLKLLLSKPNQIVVGGGNIFVVSEEENTLSTGRSIRLSYDEFKIDKGIHKAEDYYKSPEALVDLFVDHCKYKLKHLKEMSVQDAIETVGKKRYGNKDVYTKELFDHLFRLASALWSYDKGRVTEVQQLQYDRIVNLGVYDQQEGITNYDQFVTQVKGTYGIRADHTFSSTGDTQRIWLLNYAATLPVYFLSDLEQNKKRYEEEMIPTYHIDQYFEKEVPDLFPVNNRANLALRVLGMAIVPGIDVIHDRKPDDRCGHEFTFKDHDSVAKLNSGDEIKWLLFRDMYQEVTDDYDPENEGNNLLDMLKSLLQKKVESIKKDNESNLRQCIKDYIATVKKKLAARDFSRLISARLTYQEVKELEAFLSKKGYDMDIERYLKADKIG